MHVLRMVLRSLPLVGICSVLSCSTATVSHDCADGIDNDGDGFFDGDDPGCIANYSKESPDPDIPACADGADNDKDGLMDFEDPGCASINDRDEYDEPVPACRDGIDNDGDGLVDFPNDPGCLLNLENSEGDDCPNGADCPTCSNGVDDDGDGFTDFPDDPGCDSAGDNDEYSSSPSICGASARVDELISGVSIYTGRLRKEQSNDLISPTCGGSGPEAIFRFTLAKPRALAATTDFDETTLDTVLYLRGKCREPSTELICNDDLVANGPSAFAVPRLEPGEYFLVADSYKPRKSGDFKLQADFSIPKGEECDQNAGDPCSPGFVCRKLTAEAPITTCELPECEDGLDNDGDGFIDYPTEPGCDAPDDNTEIDDCPDGPNCPQCSNGKDDDIDGKTDFDSDPGCSVASDDLEMDPCGTVDEVVAVDFGSMTGTTTGQSNFGGSCSSSTSSPEVVHGLLLDRDYKTVQMTTAGSTFDTVTYVKHASCENEELACSDPVDGDDKITLETPAQGGYYIFVDGQFAQGDYVLDIKAEVFAGDSCDPSNPAVVCEGGFYCDSTTLTCDPAACNDGADNDGDSLTDYPVDPGCESPSDNDEVDDCPNGPGCPACSNTLDDDGDGFADFNSDIGCTSAGDNSEKDCDNETDAIVQVTSGETTGTSVGATNDSRSSCGGADGLDRMYALRVDSELENLHVDTDVKGAQAQLDTVVYIRGPNECTTEEVACNDEDSGVPFGASRIDLEEAIAPGIYFVVVDTYNSATGPFVLNIKGTIKAGEACDAQTVQNGLFTCSDGFSCIAGVCAQAACSNGADDDGDGKTDFPEEPGCADASDNDETDDCPDGPNCAVCSNGVDDDGDGETDYPNDLGCASAVGAQEIDPCSPGTEIFNLKDAGTSGTTRAPSTGSNFKGSCQQFSNGTEDVYFYQNKRVLSSISFAVTNASSDVHLYARTSDCSLDTSEFICVNEQFNGEETMRIDAPEQIDYYVFVDSGFGGLISYDLSITGLIATGDQCDPADTQFVCLPGNFCDAGVCAPTVCNNGIDDDGDNLVDASDPGCDSIDDDSEAPDPAPLPACSDSLDNDSDGASDYGFDIGCERASDPDEADCPTDRDSVVIIGAQSVGGNTGSAAADSTPTCADFSSSSELVHALFVPGKLETLSANLFGFSQAILEIHKGACDGVSLACESSDSTGILSIELKDIERGPYFFTVDGRFTSGIYNLEVRGVIAEGEACDPAQITAGIFECSGTTTCTAGICQ